VVTQSVGFDIELPSALGFDVLHTDREVIARADHGARVLLTCRGSRELECPVMTTTRRAYPFVLDTATAMTQAEV